MFGSHLSIAGGLENALIEARRLEMDCVQVFTKNQRQWQVPPLTEMQIRRWKEFELSTGIRDVVSHDSYLINLASPDAAMRKKSIALFGEEMIRCEELGIKHLVMHPGSHMKAGEADGLKRVAEAMNLLHDKLKGLRVVTCLEVTAGQGTNLGHRFEHLAAIIEMVEADERLGVCLDTAHMLAAGYDLECAEGAKSVLREFDGVVGLGRVRVLHLNDSKVARGKRVDRHEHIGRGHVSLEAFAVMVNEPAFAGLAKILETPKEDAPDGRPWDMINLMALRKLVRGKALGGKKSEENP
jgi:deoxyribonuclease-4